ncbi:MAG TPA: hypothetical protein VGK99_12085 [Acidobacteriota bacterium]|jgi:hypothetical protein
MKKIWAAVVSIVLWNHERGSWQYDVMCALIVAFIVFTPRSFFRGEFRSHDGRGDRQEQVLKLTDRSPAAKAGPAQGVKKQ